MTLHIPTKMLIHVFIIFLLHDISTGKQQHHMINTIPKQVRVPHYSLPESIKCLKNVI